MATVGTARHSLSLSLSLSCLMPHELQVEGLSRLVHLTQLSLEDNCIAHLSGGGLQQCVHLLELYIGNNKLAQLKEIQVSKALCSAVQPPPHHPHPTQ